MRIGQGKCLYYVVHLVQAFHAAFHQFYLRVVCRYSRKKVLYRSRVFFLLIGQIPRQNAKKLPERPFITVHEMNLFRENISKVLFKIIKMGTAQYDCRIIFQVEFGKFFA